ncbi:AroM family protein [Burkholderia anthina]|uniref:AroM family protein n=1 Tax=Burkholderia anthina TaxID=179879 RepID=UPI001FC88E6E|nr:AroM family protein [Burkholderia anthina]
MIEAQMGNRMLATLTIGQAPRKNIASVVEAAMPHGVKCVHAGLLDGLTRNEMEVRFAPRGNGRKLVTRVASGATVVLDKEAVGNALQEKIARLEAQGCESILLLCTGEFDGLSCKRARLFEPDKMVPAIIGALARSEKVGVVMPLREQIETEVAKWRILSTPALYAAASPYSDDIGELSVAARTLRERGAQILVLDCMGYEQRHRARAAREAGCPVILSNTLVAKCVAEIL